MKIIRILILIALITVLFAPEWMHRSITTQFIDMKTTHSFRSKTTQKG